MNKHHYHRKEDTGKIELQKIMIFLNNNNYHYQNIYESTIQGYSIGEFKKHISYTDKEGNWINDRYIKIYIEYHDDYDYEHNNKDKNGENVFNKQNSEKFIKNLINECCEPYDIKM